MSKPNEYLTWADAGEWCQELEKLTNGITLVDLHYHRGGDKPGKWCVHVKVVKSLSKEWGMPIVAMSEFFPSATHKTLPSLLVYMAFELEKRFTDAMRDAERQSAF